MSKKFISKEGYPNCVIYDSIAECMTDRSKETHDFLAESKINYDKAYKSEFTYICQCQRSTTKFFILNYKNGIFRRINLSIIDKNGGKNESKNEGEYTLSYALENVLKYIDFVENEGVCHRRNFTKIIKDLKGCLRGSCTSVDAICTDVDKDRLLDRLKHFKTKAYLEVVEYE